MTVNNLSSEEILNKLVELQNVLCERMLSNNELDMLTQLENEVEKRKLNKKG